jgi:hypothetical protein
MERQVTLGLDVKTLNKVVFQLHHADLMQPVVQQISLIMIIGHCETPQRITFRELKILEWEHFHHLK